MTPTRRTPRPGVRALAGCTSLLLGLALASAVPAAMAAPAQAAGSQTITYRGYRLEVPSTWSVVDLEADPQACVRLDRHAVYLGHPGQHQACPTQVYGRTEALVIEPADQSATAAADRHANVPAPAGTSPAPSPSAQAERLMRVAVTDAGVIVTESWNADRGAVDVALRTGRLVAPTTAPTSSTSVPHAAVTAASFGAPAALAANPPAVTFVQRTFGEGFDACSLPSDPAVMAGLKAQTGWVGAGFYLGGANAGCPQLGFGASWVKSVTAQGWTLIPIWVGLQINTCGGNCSTIDPNQAVQQGSAEADAAVAAAQQVGIGGTSPLYLDLEGYSSNQVNSQTAVLFTQGWTGRLHALGYTAGFYSSAGSGIADIVAAAQNGFGNMPDDLWIAHYDCSDSTADGAVPSGMWQGRRLKQYRSSSTSCQSPQQSVGFDYDSNALGGDAAGAGAGGFPAYVNKIYLDFLGRSADPGGSSYWVGQLRAGLPWQAFVYAVTTSGEHIRRSADGDFFRFLHRAPDPAGSDYWTWILGGSLDNPGVEALMTSSDEYFATQGNNDPTTWLQHLYQDTLSRAADQGGLNYWLGRLQSGTSRVAIANNFVHSFDGAAADADYAFSVTLHRTPDAGGRSYYAGVLQQFGFNIFRLDALLDSSWEAWNQAQG